MKTYQLWTSGRRRDAIDIIINYDVTVRMRVDLRLIRMKMTRTVKDSKEVIMLMTMVIKPNNQKEAFLKCK